MNLSHSSADPATQRMDLFYRRQRHFYNLTRRPYLLGRDQLLANLMLKTAARNVLRAQLTDRIHLAQSNAITFESQPAFNIKYFDRVFVSYALSMMSNWTDVMKRSFELVAPGGTLHVVDFGTLEGAPSWVHRSVLATLRRYSTIPPQGLLDQAKRIAAENGHVSASHQKYFGYLQYVAIQRYDQDRALASDNTLRHA